MVNYPGSNILNQALRVIAKQTFSYYAFISRTPNAAGLYVNTYASPISISGSVQPVARNLYQQYGLDFTKNYVMVYTPNNIIDIDRDRSSDQILFNSKAYQVLADTLWFPIDGWTACICIGVPSVG